MKSAGNHPCTVYLHSASLEQVRPWPMSVLLPTGNRQYLIFSLVIALLAGLLYLPGLPGEFMFDDIPNIVNNASIQLKHLSASGLLEVIATPQISGQMRSLPTLTFALDYWRAGGADPATFKSTNILIHALTAFALAWMFRSLLLAAGREEQRVKWLAPALALAWAIHPLQVSSVLYAVQRLQTMGTLFLVLALLAYLQARRAQIDGRSGRTGMMVTLLLWAMAMSCKEDSALFPAYTLAMELTVLRFAAADFALSTRLRRGYMLASVAGAALYCFVIVPHFWRWETYSGRDFSTPERLLTEARVLCLYLWQIVLPLPSHMPFYYDWLQPSRSLLQPWTTLTSIAVVLALLGTAWRLRSRQPFFALGVFLFFGAHFITSNVIALELAYEHRNNFALIGAVLAISSLLAQLGLRLRLRPAQQAATVCLLLLALGTATVLRAHSWSSNLLFAQASTEAAPSSPRAWIQLCASYFEGGGGPNPANPNLDKAIRACSAGTAAAPDSLNNPALLIVLKTLRGSITPQDWALFQQRLEIVRMTPDNSRAPLILKHFAEEGVGIDKQRLLGVLATLTRRASLEPYDLSSIGYFVMNKLEEPDQAMPYFTKAIQQASPQDPFPQQLAAELRAKGRPDLAWTIEHAGQNRQARIMGNPVEANP